MRKKNIVREHTVESVDLESGEIKTKTAFTTQKVDAEPDYIKLYLADMSRWSNLPRSASTVLGAILRYMNYDNIIPLNSFTKDNIAKLLNTKRQVIDNQLHKLCKDGIITRVGRGTYLANPYIFGRGKWTEIKEIRATVTYNEDGVSFSVVTNPSKQLSIPGFKDPFDEFLDRLKADTMPIDKYDEFARRMYANQHEGKKS